ncbi:MAG: right-handed parallel beta-helix repeat-containing protein [Candidatus Fermentibacteraceae bacterium]
MTALLLCALAGALFEVSPGESVQGALDQASAGDTVLLLPGIHAGSGEHLAVITGQHDGVMLLGDPQSPSSVVLDGSGLDECVLLVDGAAAGDVGQSTIVRGLTLSGGDSGADPFGGGMRLNHASPTVDLCIFEECTAENGGGAYVWKGQPVFTGCIFDQCHCESAGGGLYLYDSDAQVSHCRFLDCHSNDDGAGIYLYHSDAQMHGCLFAGGSAGDDAAAIYAYTFSFPDVGFCTFTGGSTGYGNAGAVYFRVECGGFIHDNIVADNQTTGFYGDGGASPEFSHNCVWNNQGSNYGNLPDPTGEDGNIEADPLFTGDWHLSCTAAGQPQQSPCIDAGSMGVVEAGLELYWTRTDSVFDTGTADMGYHHGPPPEWMGAEGPAAPASGALSAAPCPTTGSLELSCGGRTMQRVRILDMAGRVTYRSSGGSQLSIALPARLPSGVYLATAMVEGRRLAARVVLVRR